MNTTEPIPAASSHGSKIWERGSAHPCGFDDDDRADNRRAGQRGDGGETRRGGHQRHDLVGCVLLGRSDGKHSKTRSKPDQRCPSTEHQPDSDRCQRGQHHARKLYVIESPG